MGCWCRDRRSGAGWIRSDGNRPSQSGRCCRSRCALSRCCWILRSMDSCSRRRRIQESDNGSGWICRSLRPRGTNSLQRACAESKCHLQRCRHEGVDMRYRSVWSDPGSMVSVEHIVARVAEGATDPDPVKLLRKYCDLLGLSTNHRVTADPVHDAITQIDHDGDRTTIIVTRAQVASDGSRWSETLTIFEPHAHDGDVQKHSTIRALSVGEAVQQVLAQDATFDVVRKISRDEARAFFTWQPE